MFLEKVSKLKKLKGIWYLAGFTKIFRASSSFKIEAVMIRLRDDYNNYYRPFSIKHYYEQQINNQSAKLIEFGIKKIPNLYVGKLFKNGE